MNAFFCDRLRQMVRWRLARSVTTAVLLMFLSSRVAEAQTGSAQSAIGQVANHELETVLASSLVLTNSDAVEFGVLSFDPSEVFGTLASDISNENNVSRRRSITTANLPWHYDFSKTKTGNDNKEKLGAHHKARVRLSFLELKQDIALGGADEQADDKSTSRVFALYSGYQLGYHWSPSWRTEVDIGLHWQRYDNNYSYRNTVSQAFRGDLEGVLFNNSADAIVASSKAALIYSRSEANLPWNWQSDYTYYRGSAYNANNTLEAAEPETWTLTNTLTVKQSLPPVFGQKDRMLYSVSRIDLGGDVSRSFNTRYYYRLSVGWLVDLPDSALGVNNLGVALAVNIGSALAGGSMQIMYNERF